MKKRIKERRVNELVRGGVYMYVNSDDTYWGLLQHELDCLESNVKSINEMAEEMWK